MYDTIAARLDAADQRLIRNEAVLALQAEGAISERIADMYLADVRPTIDARTGDPVGVREKIAEWKAAHQEFFAAPIQATERKNESTAPKLVGGLPDLHLLNPRERRAAVSAYRDSLRRR